MKYAALLLIVLLIAVPVAAQISESVSVTSNGAQIGSTTVETLINSEKFTPAVTKQDGEKTQLSSGEKLFWLVDDPKVLQEYVIEGNGLKDTIYLKERSTLSYRFKGAALSLQEDGRVKIVNGDEQDGYLEMMPAIGSDAGGNAIKFDYKINGDTVDVVIQEDAKFPIVVDPLIIPRYYLKALLHGNLESADSFSTSVIRDSSTEAHMPALDVASTGSGLNTTNVKFGNASIFLKNSGGGNPVAVNMSDSSDWTLGDNNFTICTWVWQKNFTSQSFYIQQDGENYNRFNLSCPGYVSGTVSWYAKRGASTEGATGALSASALAAAEAEWNRFCVIRNGSTISLYMNNTLLGSGTSTLTKTDLAGPASFGKDDMTYFDLAGKHYDEIVFINGLGLPIDSPLLTSEWPLYVNATPNYGYGDDNNTVALLHFDDVNGGANFTDRVANRTWTRVSGSGNMSTALPKFGTANFQAPGVTLVRTSDIQMSTMGTQDFTIDGWIYARDTSPISANTNYIFWAAPYGTAAGYTVVSTGNGFVLQSNASGSWITDCSETSNPLPLNQWMHFAVERNGTAIKIFRDGTLTKSCTISAAYQYNNYYTVADIATIQNVSLDEFRITKGLARWTGNFTPPTYAYELTQPSFTMSPTESGTVPVTVTFNSSTPDDVWTQNDWYWDFGDGSTGTGRNTTHTYTTAGSYSATLQTFNNNMTAVSAATTFKPGAPVISIAISPNTGTAALLTTTTITVTNTTPITGWGFDYGDGYSDTEAPTLVSGSGTSTVWSKTHVFANYGYFNFSMNCTNSIGTDTAYDYVTVSTEQDASKLNNLYPVTSQLVFVDKTGHPVASLPVSTVMVNSTIDNTNWFSKLFGISATTTPLNGTLQSGITDSSGAISFVVSSVGLYEIDAVDASRGVNFSTTLRPEDKTYIYIVETTDTADPIRESDYIFTTEEATDLGATIRVGWNFTDTGKRTDSLMFYVNYTNGTPIYQTNAVIGTNSTWLLNYSVANTNGYAYRWGVHGNNTLFGFVNRSTGITARNTTEVAINPFVLRGHF